VAITNVQQGTLNRLLAAIVIPNFPALNVTAQYTGKEGLRLALEGNATTLIDTLTGGVTSPEPYMRCTVALHLLRSQSLAAAWKAQIETSTLLGDITAYGDSKAMPVFPLTNMSVMTIREINFDGTDPGYVVTIGGYYIINSSLYQ
jgi:hypothetical protein